jgi:hypothetical protein
MGRTLVVPSYTTYNVLSEEVNCIAAGLRHRQQYVQEVCLRSTAVSCEFASLHGVLSLLAAFSSDVTRLRPSSNVC